MTHPAQEPRRQIERVLESAVVLSWQELVQSSPTGAIQVEYGTAPEPSLQYLKMWLSTGRGAWNLICEYWMTAGTHRTPAIGLTFSNGYYSENLARMLQEVLRRQKGVPSCLAGDTAVDLIVINSPTEEDSRSAGNCMSQTYKRLGLRFLGMRGVA